MKLTFEQAMNGLKQVEKVHHNLVEFNKRLDLIVSTLHKKAA
jgi:predicted translin family RNA/ssDNA-binding protein